MEENQPILLSDDTEAFNKLFERARRIDEMEKKNIYDKKIIDFYRDGYFVINNIKISIDMINILGIQKEEGKEYILDFVNSEEPLPKDIKILEIENMKDTSIFESIINRYKEKIENNILVFDDEMVNYLNSLKWDGKYHTLVPETHEMVLRQKNS